ncbi:MAG: hypothetical protein JNL72_07605 [Flavipsychrobacter sp.]|nr:hypothetical protein [Flavipsychrobacter sp.]
MKKSIVIMALFVSGVVFVNCSPRIAATTTGAPKTEYPLAQLESGKAIWSGACTKCHKGYEPASHTAKQWERIVPRMAKKAKLDERQSADVLAYLISGAAG